MKISSGLSLDWIVFSKEFGCLFLNALGYGTIAEWVKVLTELIVLF
ncbi:MAG: hypothetical protein AAGA64_05965 [Bacteroidota bacterium]